MRSWATGAVVGMLFVSSCGSDRPPFTEKPGSGKDGGVDGLGKDLPGIGPCNAEGLTCFENKVFKCSDAGPGDFVKDCEQTGECCLNGECAASCAAAEAWGSNVGCEFWAVDLDNEWQPGSDAAGAPWGVVVSNFGKTPVTIVVEKNDGPPGGAQAISAVMTEVLQPGTLKELTLPTREVDGSTSANNGPGTMVSSNAFRIRSDVPIVAYQFNTLKNSFSNDASLLLPKNGLGSIYRALGYPAANSIVVPGLPKIPGIPDHAYVTIVGTQPGTTVTVTVPTPTLAGGPVPARKKGEVITQVLGPFDVLNIETDGYPGDMTGTIVTSSAPVAVFSGSERATSTGGGGDNPEPPNPPGFDPSSKCCTDHIEEQLLPVTSYGKTFVITRSPIRSTGGYVEPDFLRFMGVAATTTVRTSLPSPHDTFTLQPGEKHDTWTQKDIIVEATEPLAIGQILVSQAYTKAPIAQGDPSLTIPPPVDQYRSDYLFNVPSSWGKNFGA